jgi:hypothetical protein
MAEGFACWDLCTVGFWAGGCCAAAEVVACDLLIGGFGEGMRRTKVGGVEGEEG